MRNKIIEANIIAPYWLITAVDICLEKGSLKKMLDTAEANKRTHSMIFGDGYACFCMTSIGLISVGWFDENIYPAYLEDSDHFYRVRLSGLPATGVPDFKFVHGDGMLTGSVTINSNPQYKRANALTHARNHEYYKQKWGGDGGEEKYKTPFNNPLLPIEYWELDLDFRTEQERIWRETV